ncbi:unnamed protein product [Amoebophrya sp. A120]|nr:unnamed protein product [Amoebophrya sp. A120]|eukprot:GSA120T00015514001.1
MQILGKLKVELALVALSMMLGLLTFAAAYIDGANKMASGLTEVLADAEFSDEPTFLGDSFYSPEGEEVFSMLEPQGSGVMDWKLAYASYEDLPALPFPGNYHQDDPKWDARLGLGGTTYELLYFADRRLPSGLGIDMKSAPAGPEDEKKRLPLGGIAELLTIQQFYHDNKDAKKLHGFLAPPLKLPVSKYTAGSNKKTKKETPSWEFYSLPLFTPIPARTKNGNLDDIFKKRAMYFGKDKAAGAAADAELDRHAWDYFHKGNRPLLGFSATDVDDVEEMFSNFAQLWEKSRGPGAAAALAEGLRKSIENEADPSLPKEVEHFVAQSVKQAKKRGGEHPTHKRARITAERLAGVLIAGRETWQRIQHIACSLVEREWHKVARHVANKFEHKKHHDVHELANLVLEEVAGKGDEHKNDEGKHHHDEQTRAIFANGKALLKKIDEQTIRDKELLELRAVHKFLTSSMSVSAEGLLGVKSLNGCGPAGAPSALVDLSLIRRDRLEAHMENLKAGKGIGALLHWYAARVLAAGVVYGGQHSHVAVLPDYTRTLLRLRSRLGLLLLGEADDVRQNLVVESEVDYEREAPSYQVYWGAPQKHHDSKHDAFQEREQLKMYTRFVLQQFFGLVEMKHNDNPTSPSHYLERYHNPKPEMVEHEPADTRLVKIATHLSTDLYTDEMTKIDDPTLPGQLREMIANGAHSISEESTQTIKHHDSSDESIASTSSSSAAAPQHGRHRGAP